MDRLLEPHVLLGRKRKRLIQIGIVVGISFLLFWIFSAWIRPTVKRSEIQTAIVQRGVIEGSVSAAGTVVPKFEQSISSPGETRLLAVKKKPGEYVKKGEPLLDLDRSELTLSLERTGKELSLKANHRTQLKLDMEKTLTDLQGQTNIKDLRLQYLRSKSDQAVKMLKLGAISKDQYDQTTLEEHIAAIERKDLEQSIENTKQSLENQLSGVTTEVQTLLKEKADIQRQLDLLSCRAEHNGVVTWVREDLGTTIHRGDIIARVADLSSYRVEATISDIHASRLSVGMPAKIRLNELTIPGHVETIYPTIENGIAKLSLSLENAPHTSLRPNLRVDVSLILNKRENVLKVRKGPFITGATQNVFVIRGSAAERTPVTLGAMSFDEVEMVTGVSEGDEMIVSDMTEYNHLTQIKIH